MSTNVADWLRRLGRQGQSGEGITADETRRVICWRPFREFLIRRRSEGRKGAARPAGVTVARASRPRFARRLKMRQFHKTVRTFPKAAATEGRASKRARHPMQCILAQPQLLELRSNYTAVSLRRGDLRERSTGRITILRPYNCLNHIAYIRDFQMDPVGAIPDDRREILLQVQRGPQWPGNARPASTPPYSSG